jgi:hypothetical protein
LRTRARRGIPWRSQWFLASKQTVEREIGAEGAQTDVTLL